jgi:excisionase family DNA binding protein
MDKKYTLTVKEAAAYYGIGIKRLRKLAEEHRDSFGLKCGNRFLIIREKFEEYLLKESEV